MLPIPPRPPQSAAVALVPLRTGGKSRLQDTLDATHRADLVLAMLDDVLRVLRAAGLVDIRLLAGDDGAVSAAADRALVALRDPPSDTPGSSAPGSAPSPAPHPREATSPADERLRRAVDAGLATVGDGAARLVIAADLPLLRPADVAVILASRADVTVAPTRGGGTAVLRLAPGVSIPTCYGPGSAQAHLAAARGRGLRAELLDLAGTRSDVDAAADLDELGDAGQIPVGPATATFLAATRG